MGLKFTQICISRLSLYDWFDSSMKSFVFRTCVYLIWFRVTSVGKKRKKNPLFPCYFSKTIRDNCSKSQMSEAMRSPGAKKRLAKKKRLANNHKYRRIRCLLEYIYNIPWIHKNIKIFRLVHMPRMDLRKASLLIFGWV